MSNSLSPPIVGCNFGPGLRAGDLSDVAMIWVAAPAREWVHMWVQEEEDFDSQLFLDQGVAAL